MSAVSSQNKRNNRPVWVVLDFPERPGEPYVEEWRGNKYIIPPDGKKQVVMKYLAARRFLQQPTVPAEALRLPNGKYEAVPKALKIIEMTPEEMQDNGYNPKDYVLADKDAGSSLICALCGSQAANEKGLKVHMTKMHPDASPIEEE